MKRGRRRVKVGYCGFRTAMAEYVRQFPVVEVQQTFYQPPQASTLERWRESAPANFEFTIKAWQVITHEARSPTYKRLKRPLSDDERAQCGAFRPTPLVEEAWQTTLACARALSAERILFQCPASFTPIAGHVADMRRFFGEIERGGGLRLLWEPRGDWPADLIRALCRELDLAHVVDPFAARTQTPDQCYFRLHGRGGWGYVYEDDELAELLEMLPAGQTSYVMFNNVRMREDATRFQALAGLKPDPTLT